MTSKPSLPDSPDWQTVVQALGSEPALLPFVRNGAILLWSLDGQELLHANAAGRKLIGAEETVQSPSSDRLRLLGTGLAPRNGVRLERLRLVPGVAGALLTCACRRVSDKSGREALLTALSAAELRRIGTAIRLNALEGSHSPDASQPSIAAPVAAEAAAPAPPRQLRFTWESDADRRITQVSAELAGLIGADAAAELPGASWDHLLATRVLDVGGGLAAALRQDQTWNGCTVLWQLADTDRGRSVQLSAMPVLRDGIFAGFRGFGLVKAAPDQPFIRPRPAPEPAPETQAPDVARSDMPPPAGRDRAETAAPARDSVVRLRLPRAAQLQTEVQAARDVIVPAPNVVAAIPLTQSAPAQSAPAQESPAPDAPRETPKPSLTPVERNAFREIAQALGARIDHDMRLPPAGVPLPARNQYDGRPEAISPLPPPAESLPDGHAELLDRLPIAVMVRRDDRVLYANRTLLDLLDHAGLDDLNAAGGPERSIAGVIGAAAAQVALIDRHGERIEVDAQAEEITWQGKPATLLSFRRARQETAEQPRLDALALDVAARDARLAEMTAVLDTATDGVVTVDERGRILSLNRSAEALFGFDQREVTGDLFTLLLAPESHTRALDYLEGLKGGGVASVLNDGREVMGRVRQGGRITLFMTMGQIAQARAAGSSAGSDSGRKFCAVLRDITAWKKTELELVEARRQAEKASAQKSDVLAKISHEIRTPLNAIIGFSEVMAEERFGPIGNERYREYLRDIHESGGYVISLVNDLLDLAKIEAGKLDLDFVSVNLNDIAVSSVALLQPEAQRGRVVLRSGLSPRLPPVVADERSIRQIMINILSNAVKFTDAGGQVIVSSALGDKGEAIIRVRDTGIGMSESDLKLALEPFRQVPSTRKAGGTGLGLPLTKALVEANRASLAITSAKNEGTLIEITFPPQRVLAS